MSILTIQQRILYLIGFDLKATTVTAFGLLYTWASLMLLILILWPELRYVLANLSDLRLVTDGLAPLLCSLTSVCKLVTIRLTWYKFSALFRNLQRLRRQSPSSAVGDADANANADDLLLMDQAYAKESRLSKPYIGATMMVGLLYLLFPIVKSCVELRTTGATVWEMPMRSIFFYDVTRSPNYELTYAWFVQATLLVALSAVGIDTLFYACAWNLVGHFRIAQRRFATIARPNSEAQFRRHFGSLVRYHAHIIGLVRRLSDAYRPIMLTQFLITSLLLCVIAYQLTLSNQRPVVFVIYVVFLLAICFQCFVYCHGGTTLHTESEALAAAIYAGRWHEATAGRQRLLLFCLMRAQQPVQIRAGFFSANLPMFSSIISTAGSYIALLQSMSD